MIAGLVDFVKERCLPVPTDLKGAVVGADASISEDLGSILKTAAKHGFSLFVVLDGPAVQLLPHYGPRQNNTAGPRWLIRELTSRNIPWLVAPGYASAQLTALHRSGIITHVLGNHGGEALMFGDIPFIVDLPPSPSSSSPPSTGATAVMSRKLILDSLGIPEHVFVEFCLGAGCNIFMIPPAIIETGSGFAGAAKAAQLGGGSLFAAIAAREQSKIETFQRALATVAWQPYLTESGEVRLTNRHNQSVPRNTHEIIGYRLPDEYQWYISKGYLGTDLCHAVTYTRLDDPFRPRNPDLVRPDGMYARLQTKTLSPLRKLALGLLTSRLQRYFQMKTVVDLAAAGAQLIKPGLGAPRLSAPGGSFPLKDVNAIVESIQASVYEIAGLEPSTKPLQAAAELVKRGIAPDSVPDLNTEIGQYLNASARLVLRQIMEAVLVTRFSLGHFDRDVDHAGLILKLAWY